MILGRLAGKLPQYLSRRVSVQKNLLIVTFARGATSDASSVTSKSAYEIEVQRFKIKDNKHHVNHGFVENSPYEDDLFHRCYYFVWCTLLIGFGMPLVLYGPDWMDTGKHWRRREALIVLEKRLANGETPINPNFAPADMIEDMVPEAGPWEQSWLGEQPAVKGPWQQNLRKVVNF